MFLQNNLTCLAWAANEKVKLPHTLCALQCKDALFHLPAFILGQSTETDIIIQLFFYYFFPNVDALWLKGAHVHFCPAPQQTLELLNVKCSEPLCRAWNGATEAGVIKASQQISVFLPKMHKQQNNLTYCRAKPQRSTAVNALQYFTLRRCFKKQHACTSSQ